MSDGDAPAFTRDAFYGGRLVLAQPLKGHRSGTDAVLLASAVPAGFAGRCTDIGAGVGAVGLGVALLHPQAHVTLVERDPEVAALARVNAADMSRSDAVEVAVCDILDAPARRAALPHPADLVVTNPPFNDPRRHRPSPDARRCAAHALAEGTSLADWIGACLACLDDKGTLIAIHVAAALPELLAALAGRAGAVTAKPIHPRTGAPAHRVLVRATRGSRAPFALASPLLLHESCGRFTEEAARLHAGEAVLDW